MENLTEDILESIFRLDGGVVEVGVAHSKMIDALLEALAIAEGIDEKTRKKWFRVVNSHKKLGKEIRQLLFDVNRLRQEVNRHLKESTKS